MSRYSIELLNDFNERALDFNDVMYKQQTGTCQRWHSDSDGWDSFMMTPWRGINAQMRGMVVSIYSGTGSWGYTGLPQFAPGGTYYVGNLNGFHNIYGHNAFPSFDEEVFVEMPNVGLMMLLSFIQKYTRYSVGTQMICQPYPGAPVLKYVTVNTNEPGIRPEQYGMTIHAEDGRRVFDSRHQIVAVQDHVTFTAGEIYNVLYNGWTVDKPLRKTFIKPYVSSVDFNSARLIAGNPDKMWLPRIRILNGNTMRMTSAYFSKSANSAPIDYGYTHDTTILIAEMG